MKYPFSVYLMEANGHSFWVAESNSLEGCVGQADTQEQAIAQLMENEEAWIEAANELSIEIPKVPTYEPNSFSGKFTVRVSPLVHEKAFLCAKKLGISLNQFVNDAILIVSSGKDALYEVQKVLRGMQEVLLRSETRNFITDYKWETPTYTDLVQRNMITASGKYDRLAK